MIGRSEYYGLRAIAFAKTRCRFADGRDLEANVIFESDHFASIVAMVSAGAGVSIVPRMVVEAQRLQLHSASGMRGRIGGSE